MSGLLVAVAATPKFVTVETDRLSTTVTIGRASAARRKERTADTSPVHSQRRRVRRGQNCRSITLEWPHTISRTVAGILYNGRY